MNYKNITHRLTDFGFTNPVKHKEETKMAKEEWKEATTGEGFKFENAGDSIQGKFLGIETSVEYPDSFVVRLDTKDGNKFCFVNNIVKDMLEKNNILVGSEIRIDYKGKRKTKDGKREYKDFALLYKG